ncbi:MAG: ATP synthase F1 subunit delta [Planctomycetes bacterium]|nr:ATP synthase F1 subunit delta [Planctomycetota bacterium]
MSSLARRWAKALFEVAHARGALETVGTDLVGIDDVLADPTIRAVVARPELSPSVRRTIVKQLGEGRHEFVRNLLEALGARRRLAVLLDLRAAFDALVLESRNEVVAVVESAHEIAGSMRGQLVAMAHRLSGRVAHLQFEVKPELVGGIRLRVGNTLWDGSVAAALGELRLRLLAAPLARAST